MAVTQQPSSGFMPMVPPIGQIHGVPPGLEHLMQKDQLIIKQKIEVMEVLTGCETKNKYNVLNKDQQQLFYAYEESECCHRVCCGPGRGFIFHVQDNNGQEVLTLERPFKCCAGCPCLADKECCQFPINVKDCHGNLLGTMRMTPFCCTPEFGIFDTTGLQVYGIRGVCCPCQCPCCKEDINHPIFNMSDKSQVGNIAKQWKGAFREFITDADTYCLTFPADMHVVHKALLFASVFLVDMTVYENQDGGGGA